MEFVSDLGASVSRATSLSRSSPFAPSQARSHFVPRSRIVDGLRHEHADAPQPLALLRACREWPSRSSAAEQRDERAALHALPPQGVRVAHYHSVAGERCCCITAKLIL